MDMRRLNFRREDARKQSPPVPDGCRSGWKVSQ
jgi:hypothetical protein